MNYTDIFRRVAEAGRSLVTVDAAFTAVVLRSLADEAENESRALLEANKIDLEAMDPCDPKYDRVMLNEERIVSIASDIRSVAALPSPAGTVRERRRMPNGLEISKVTVPFGVIGFIYEARPNVTFDVFALCLRSGNACLLKGGSEARHSNTAIAGLIKNVIAGHGLDTSVCELLPAERNATEALLSARGYVDVIIPRGGKGLIEYVTMNSQIPVIETGAGIVHTYLDSVADTGQAAMIIKNAKTRRVSVCNALDCLIVHSLQLPSLHIVLSPLAEKGVILHADTRSFETLEGRYPSELLLRATGESFGTEFLSGTMAIKTVDDLDGALDHIRRYSSKHSEAIISSVPANTERFLKEVDAAVVYSNASTAFTDGGQFGLGAETGISTQKLHARGPMALEEMTTYKWVVRGAGQVRD